MAVEEWVSAAQREDTVQRVTANICALSHAKGIELSDDVVRKVAEVLEQRAFTAAQVSAVTTTGARPVVETTKAYARKLSELLLEVVQNGGALTADTKTAGDSEAVDLFGSRDFLTKESTEAALAALLAPGSKVKKVRLSTKSFGSDAAQVAATALANVSATLVDADLSDIIAGRPESEALEALRVVSSALIPAKLQRLNLSDNALGEKGVRACGELLSAQASLQSLSLQNVGCSIHACRAVSELLQSAGELRQLHLFNNMSDNQGAKHIADVLARAPLMEDFKMASSRVGPSGGISLARALEAGTCLVRLDISDNPMTSDVAPALASLIAKQPHLRALNLNDTSLGNDGVVAVALALQNSAPQLEELELALNEVTAHGARAVALAVVNKSKLWKLNVRENELEDKGAVILATALSALKSLRVVDACGNQLRRAGALALAKAVAEGTNSLELLALDENQISEAGMDAVKATLESAGKLQALGPLDENEEDGDEDEEGDALAEDGDVVEAMSQLSELMNSALMFSVKR